MIEIKQVKTENQELYGFVEELMHTAFPAQERRDTPQQREYSDSNPLFCNNVIVEDGKPVGMISYWDMGDFYYIEHFAINNEIRGKGYGSTILNKFIKSTPKTILLEIDPIIDDISNACLRFYKRCGFWENPYSHTHPSYRDEYQPHHLIVLTTEKQLFEDEYQTFYKDLSVTVMKRLK